MVAVFIVTNPLQTWIDVVLRQGVKNFLTLQVDIEFIGGAWVGVAYASGKNRWVYLGKFGIGYVGMTAVVWGVTFQPNFFHERREVTAAEVTVFFVPGVAVYEIWLSGGPSFL